MSTAFADFLREKAAHRATEQQLRQEKIAEWREAIEKLLATMRNWLSESDPDGLLKLEVDQCEITEEGLGKYTVPWLNIYGLGRWVGVVPKARFTVATAFPSQKVTPERAVGRVDITNEIKRFVLYRFKSEPDDIWMIDDLKSGMKPFDRERFEAALMSYLQ